MSGLAGRKESCRYNRVMGGAQTVCRVEHLTVTVILRVWVKPYMKKKITLSVSNSIYNI